MIAFSVASLFIRFCRMKEFIVNQSIIYRINVRKTVVFLLKSVSSWILDTSSFHRWVAFIVGISFQHRNSETGRYEILGFQETFFFAKKYDVQIKSIMFLSLFDVHCLFSCIYNIHTLLLNTLDLCFTLKHFSLGYLWNFRFEMFSCIIPQFSCIESIFSTEETLSRHFIWKRFTFRSLCFHFKKIKYSGAP